MYASGIPGLLRCAVWNHAILRCLLYISTTSPEVIGRGFSPAISGAAPPKERTVTSTLSAAALALKVPTVSSSRLKCLNGSKRKKRIALRYVTLLICVSLKCLTLSHSVSGTFGHSERSEEHTSELQ